MRSQGESGQATVELVALLPLLAAIALAVLAFAAAHGAREAADQAAVAGAVAQLQGGDPAQAARAASPGWSHPRVDVARGTVTVQITPRVPGFVARVVAAKRSVVFDAAAAR